jgi:hypothetical protein
MKTILEKLAELTIGCGIVAVVMAIVAIVIGFPIKWLWNWIMPAIFGLPEISFWMALGISFLISFLFRGILRINTKKE